MLGHLVRSGLAFTASLGAAAFRANAEIFLRSAMRQQGLVIHHYRDIFDRQRRIHASMEALRQARFTANVRAMRARQHLPPGGLIP